MMSLRLCDEFAANFSVAYLVLCVDKYGVLF